MTKATTTLISFLGKQPHTGYKTTTYEIDGQSYETAYFGSALAKHVKPDRVLLLGTSSSMWDFLIEPDDEGTEQENSRIKLKELAEQEKVDEAILQQFLPFITKHFGESILVMRKIPHAREIKDQLEILAIISKQIPKNQRVIMDVTHGFRHLPMLGLLAAHYLERIKHVKVEHIYYGALDMTKNGITPVLDLSGLLRMMDWIQAFAAYDASGNYAPFSDLLSNEGWNEQDCQSLREAAFFERITNLVEARKKLDSLEGALKRRDGTFINLFGEELEKRLSWWKTGQRSDWEASLAKAYFDQRDYLRACIFTYEACLSASLPAGGQYKFNKQQRDDHRNQMKKNDPRFANLEYIRNFIAHGTGSERVKDVLEKENLLSTTLGEFIEKWETLGKPSSK